MCFLTSFEFRNSNRQLWASLSNIKGLLTLFQSYYKNFIGFFIKIWTSPDEPSMLEGYPLYWTQTPNYQVADQLENLDARNKRYVRC